MSEKEEGSIDDKEDNVCRDFLRNVCRRGDRLVKDSIQGVSDIKCSSDVNMPTLQILHQRLLRAQRNCRTRWSFVMIFKMVGATEQTANSFIAMGR